MDKYLDIAPSSGAKLLGYLKKGFYSAWLGSLEKSLGFLERAEELADAVEAKRQMPSLNRLRQWIYFDRHEFDLSRKYSAARLRSSTEKNPENEVYYEALYKSSLGLMDLEEGKLDLAKGKLREIDSALPRVISTI